MSNLLQSMSDALARVEDTRKQAANQDALRREYVGLLHSADPSKAGRLREVSDALGRSPQAILNDLAMIHPAAPATPPAPPPDFSKMTGHELLTYACKQQTADMVQAPPVIPPQDPATMNSQQLLALGMSRQPAPTLLGESVR